MGNLDFLEKKPRIAYTLSWDGVTEGKVTNTTAVAKKAYKISDEIFIPNPEIDFNASLSKMKVPNNITILDTFYIKAFGSDSKGTYLAYPVVNDTELNGTLGAYQFDLYFKDKESVSDYNPPIELYYILVTDKEISVAFGNVNPTFPEKGWYIYVPSSVTYTGDLMSILKDPLVQYSYSGKGFASPQKLYRYVSRSVKPDDDICIWINTERIPKTNEEQQKGFNAICRPEDFNSEAVVKLDKDFAFFVDCCNNFICSLVQQYGNDRDTNIMRHNMRVMIDVGYAEGLYISQNGENIFFDPNITEDDYYDWFDKYFSNPRP